MESHDSAILDGSVRESLSPTSTEEFRRQSEQELLDRLMRSWTANKRHNETLKAKACHQKRCLMVDELAETWLLENEFITPEVQVFLLSEVLPTLIVALEKLLMLVEKRGLMNKMERDRNFNPINSLAQFLMRNNPRYSNFDEASPYIRGLRLVTEQMKMKLLSMSSGRVKGLYEVKAEMRQRIRQKELDNEIEAMEMKQRQVRLAEQFNEWNNGNRIELAVIQNVLTTFKSIMKLMLLRDHSSSAEQQMAAYENLLQPTDQTGRCVFQSGFIEYLNPYIATMNEMVFDEFMRELSFYGKIYQSSYIAANRREQLKELFHSCDVSQIGLLSRHRVLEVLQDFYDRQPKAIKHFLRNPRKWPVMDYVDISGYQTEDQFWSDLDFPLGRRSAESVAEKEKSFEGGESSAATDHADDNKEGGSNEDGDDDKEKEKEEEIERESEAGEGDKETDKDSSEKLEEKYTEEDSQVSGRVSKKSISGDQGIDTLAIDADGEEEEVEEEEVAEEEEEEEEFDEKNSAEAELIEKQSNLFAEQENMLIKKHLDGISEESLNMHSTIKPVTVGDGMVTGVSISALDYKKFSLHVEMFESSKVTDDDDMYPLPQSRFSRDVVDLTRFIWLFENFLGGVMTANDELKPKPLQKVKTSDHVNTEPNKTDLDFDGDTQPAAKPVVSRNEDISEKEEEKKKRKKLEQEEEVLEWIPPHKSMFHKIITYFRELYGEENEKYIDKSHIKHTEEKEVQQLLTAAYNTLNRDLSGYIRLDLLEDSIHTYKSIHVRLTDTKIVEILNSAKQKMFRNVDVESHRLNKKQFIEYVRTVSQLSSRLMPLDLLAKHLTSVIVPVRNALGHVREARRRTRQRWLDNIISTGLLSRGSLDPLYKTVFYVLQKDIKLHGEFKIVNMTIGLIVRTSLDRFATAEGVEEGEGEGEDNDSPTPTQLQVIGGQDRGPLALRYVAASSEHAKHVLGKTLYRNMKGVSFTAVETGKPIYIERVSAHSSIHFWDIKKREKNIDGSFLVLPLVDSDGRSYGVLSMDTLRAPRRLRASRMSRASRYLSMGSDIGKISVTPNDTAANDSMENIAATRVSRKSGMDFYDAKVPGFSIEDIHFYEGVAHAFSTAFHMISEQQRMIDLCERAVGWLHQQCIKIKASKLYLIEPDRDHRGQFNLVLLMSGEAFGGPIRHAEPTILNRLDNKFSEYIFRCAESSELVIEEVNREVHVVIPVRGHHSKPSFVCDVNLGPAEPISTSMSDLEEMVSLTDEKPLAKDKASISTPNNEYTEDAKEAEDQGLEGRSEVAEENTYGEEEEQEQPKQKQDEEGTTKDGNQSQSYVDDESKLKGNQSQRNSIEKDKAKEDENETLEEEDIEEEEDEEESDEFEAERRAILKLHNETLDDLTGIINEPVSIDLHTKWQISHFMKLIEKACSDIHTDITFGKRTKFLAADQTTDQHHVVCQFDRVLLVEARRHIHKLDSTVYERLLGSASTPQETGSQFNSTPVQLDVLPSTSMDSHAVDFSGTSSMVMHENTRTSSFDPVAPIPSEVAADHLLAPPTIAITPPTAPPTILLATTTASMAPSEQPNRGFKVIQLLHKSKPAAGAENVAWVVMRCVLALVYPELLHTGFLNQLHTCRQMFNDKLTRDIVLFDPTSEDASHISAIDIVSKDVHNISAEHIINYPVSELKYFYNWLCAVVSLLELTLRHTTRPNSTVPVSK